MSTSFHVSPRPETVAHVMASCGREMAAERWGWLDISTLDRLAVEGRRISGRTRPRHRFIGSDEILNVSWDGRAPDRLSPRSAAAALGLTASTLTLGNA